ncbi:MAG: PEP/pyruvate-binding domain-containing protein [Thermodesulfobacteriota bacterium]|nr:PEP/pyruvate-binding domain-containing protein [Thermodesulfobacteriota bacterium]
MPSKALEVNIAYSRVDVTVDQRYEILQEVMGEYHGVRERLLIFLEEICHPYKNWEFIVKEARGYALNYFHVLRAHPKGPEAARLYIDIFFQAIDSSRDEKLRINASDNLLSFIQKIIKDAGTDLFRFLPVLDYAFDRIRHCPKKTFALFVKSFYQLNRLGRSYSQAVPSGSGFTAINHLLIKYFRFTYGYWLERVDPLVWFEKESGKAELNEIFRPVSHKQLKAYHDKLENIVSSADDGPKTILDQIVELPGYGQIITIYSEIPQELLSAGDDKAQGNHWKLLFLLRIMDVTGLSPIHEETLRDINRTLAWLIHHEDPLVIQQSLEKTFAILRMSTEKFPVTALNCVLNMGQGVYKTDESELVGFFIDSVVSLGFQAPEIKGVGKDWQIKANPAHIQNIRTWIQLIELNPKWSKKLLSSLIIHLSLSGVLIKDTDLFPRDITQLLNSDIGPVYNLVKQLTRLFPTYFNDIGAEGRLRDISTEIDEICLRKDTLIHFLRKQSHVESNNRIIDLMEAVLNFWRTRNKEGIRPFVPPDSYEQIETEGLHVDGVHRVITHLFSAGELKDVTDLLNIEDDCLKALAGEIPGVSELDFKRIKLAVTFYKLLDQKYHLGLTETNAYLAQLRSSGLPDIIELEKTLGEKDVKQRLTMLLAYLEKLKGVILSSKGYEVRENIYRKRHLTVDIPSMYGSYHEMKFDALGLTFRLESLLNVLFEEIVETIDLKLITRATFFQIFDYLRLFDQALKLDGVSSLEMKRKLDLLAHSLKIRGFSLTQYLDIFRGFSQAVRNITNDYFNNIHSGNLSEIMDQMQTERLMPKYLPTEGTDDRKKLPHRITEMFLRDRIATSLGLQQLDLFISRILNTLYHQSDELPKEDLRLLLSYDPQKVVTPIYPVNKGVSDIIHLGNKGFNLVKLNSYGLPVPPGFIITTEVFRCREVVDHYAPAKKNFDEQIALEVSALEKMTGKTFGDPNNPLLLAVRSGSAIPQPGMMDTFLDVGINEDIVQGMVKQTDNEWFSWDTYRRFLQSYGMAFGLERDEFDDIIVNFKKRLGKPYKRYFSGPHMKDIALTYKSLILDNGIEIEESPFEQLLVAIRKVFDSWNTPKAETYRKILGISDDWGTAVMVQAMVFGNLSRMSGAGVFFTHSPRWSGDKLGLWGDFTLGNQGEDVVSGLVSTLPISIKQAQIENRRSEKALEFLFPEIFNAMREWAKELVYNRKWSPQEIEFTFESPEIKDLYSLQTRNMAIREREKVYSFDLEERQPANFLGHGIAVSGGAMTGRIVFSLEEIHHWRRAGPGISLILIRNDTVPDDIQEVYEADGLLTARGGSTSHAAIVAHRLGKTCVVGCADLVCMEKQRTCSLNGKELKSGDWISIDGLEGSIYSGQMKIKEIERN